VLTNLQTSAGDDETLEGRAHTEATLEMSKCYLSVFYVDSADRIVDDNALATHRWDGMTRHEIMKHAEFLSELDYVKLKAYDFISGVAAGQSNIPTCRFYRSRAGLG